jgi:hypothetical protein
MNFPVYRECLCAIFKFSQRADEGSGLLRYNTVSTDNLFTVGHGLTPKTR